MVQSRLASTESVPVLVPWPKRPCPCSFSPSPLVEATSTATVAARHAPTTIANGLFASRSRAKTDGLHMRPPHYEAFFLLSPSAVWVMAVVSGPTASIAGIFPRPGARWLVSCCFLVFLAPSLHQPRLCEMPRWDRPAGWSILSGPFTSTISFCKAPYLPPALFLDHVAVVPRSWTSHLD